MYFDHSTGNPCVGGTTNKNADGSEVKFTVDHTKRFIGRYWFDPVVELLKDDLTYQLV